jgi:hypothetical protein
MERFKEFVSSVLGIFRKKNSEDNISHKQNVSDSVLQFPELDNLLEGLMSGQVQRAQNCLLQ